MKNDGQVRKKGSGRTKGATSLVSVRMEDLLKKFKANDMIVCGRVFLREAGIEDVAPAISAPLSESAKAGINVIEL